jgi:hypothetical protein
VPSCFDFENGIFRLSDRDVGLIAGVTGRQGMRTPPEHLISPLMFRFMFVFLFWGVFFPYKIPILN